MSFSSGITDSAISGTSFWRKSWWRDWNPWAFRSAAWPFFRRTPNEVPWIWALPEWIGGGSPGFCGVSERAGASFLEEADFFKIPRAGVPTFTIGEWYAWLGLWDAFPGLSGSLWGPFMENLPGSSRRMPFVPAPPGYVGTSPPWPFFRAGELRPDAAPIRCSLWSPGRSIFGGSLFW